MLFIALGTVFNVVWVIKLVAPLTVKIEEESDNEKSFLLMKHKL